MITALPTARPAYGLKGTSQAAPWITLPRRAPLISLEILSNHMGPALIEVVPRNCNNQITGIRHTWHWDGHAFAWVPICSGVNAVSGFNAPDTAT